MDFFCLSTFLWIAVSTIAVILAILLILIRNSDCDLLMICYQYFGKKPESLAGKVIWITGASSGIGEHLAYRLARAGCRLVLSARTTDKLESVKQRCLEYGKLKDSDVFVLPLDLTDFESHPQKAQDILDHFGQIDVLVNNGGRSQRAMVVETELIVDKQMLELNVLGPISMTKAVLPHMRERKSGHVVVTSSASAVISCPSSASYSAAKYALHGWFEAARIELTPDNIDFTLLCPGPVFSDLLKVAFTGKANVNVGGKMKPTENRMKTDRCADLIAVALANRPYEAWMSNQPVLFWMYNCRYLPFTSAKINVWLGTKINAKFREGQD